MKSASKIPFKGKKTPYNLNEVDVNLLLKNPSSIRKVVKGNKEEHYHDDDEEGEDDDRDEDAAQDAKLERHMKRYISEYFDNKYKKESEQTKKSNFNLMKNEARNFMKNYMLKEFQNPPKETLPHKPSSISDNIDHVIEKTDKTIGNIKKYPYDLMKRIRKKTKPLKSNVLNDLTKEEFEKLKKEHLEEQIKNKSFLRHKNIIPGIELIDNYMIMNKEAKKRLKEREEK